MKKIAILQSNYIPWKGYFDLINMVDEFVIYDDMQYTKRDWRNRNKIQTPQGLKWLSIPVEVKGKYFQRINETRISDLKWSRSHWNIIKHNYSNARYFNDYKLIIEDYYLNTEDKYLSQINHKLIVLINKILGITTKIHRSEEFELPMDKNGKLLSICKELNADIYLSGPSAKEYLDKSIFVKNKINVDWMDYSGYPEYKQLWEPFEHGVTILDLIFNEGKNATKFMKTFN
jgi:hypothetical protein